MAAVAVKACSGFVSIYYNICARRSCCSWSNDSSREPHVAFFPSTFAVAQNLLARIQRASCLPDLSVSTAALNEDIDLPLPSFCSVALRGRKICCESAIQQSSICCAAMPCANTSLRSSSGCKFLLGRCELYRLPLIIPPVSIQESLSMQPVSIIRMFAIRHLIRLSGRFCTFKPLARRLALESGKSIPAPRPWSLS